MEGEGSRFGDGLMEGEGSRFGDELMLWGRLRCETSTRLDTCAKGMGPAGTPATKNSDIRDAA